jgi:hypothetical protein
MIQIDGYLIHTVRQAVARYNLTIDDAEYVSICRKIAFQEASETEGCVRLSHASGGREKWAIWYKGEWLPLIFDPKQARIVTILPKCELRRFKGQLPW